MKHPATIRNTRNTVDTAHRNTAEVVTQMAEKTQTTGHVSDNPSEVGPSVAAAMSGASKTLDSSSLNDAACLIQAPVCFDEISFIEKVGHGSFGVVYKAIWQDQFVAVKEFGASAEQKAIETEVKQLSRVRHDNIIALFGISVQEQSKYLIMEYAEGGSLHSFLHGKVKPYYSTAHAMSWARQCAEGVAYLHAMKPKPLIHRDLKPLNLLLTNKGRHLKICDFGTVADKSTLMTNNKGSAAWMAPEVFEGSKYTEKCDIFSWAIILWEVLSRQQPFKEVDNTHAIMWKIHKGERPELIKDCPEPIEKLMTSCWAEVPDLRPSMQHVLHVMNELTSFFPGSDEALEYEFVNQQILRTDSRDELDNYNLDFSSFTPSINSTTSTQVTPTNTSSLSNMLTPPTPMNVEANIDVISLHTEIPTASITHSSRWGAILEESEFSAYSASGELLNSILPAAMNRMDTIRYDIPQMANVPMRPLSVDVNPNAWELTYSDGGKSFAKSDGKNCLTVTDVKPLIISHGTITEKGGLMRTSKDTIPSNDNSNGGSNVDDDDNDDDGDSNDDENDGTDQYLSEILDTELQPVQPIPDNVQSQQIYLEHRRLAKEYLRVDTKLCYAQEKKKKLLKQMVSTERHEKQEVLKKLSEKEELLALYNNLKQQLEKIRIEQTNSPVTTFQQDMSQINTNAAYLPPNELVADDGWVVIPPDQNT